MNEIRKALLSVYHKDGLDIIAGLLAKHGVELYSTGGTQQYLESLGFHIIPVENVTGYPSIMGGRVKTLHPGVFGGILARRDIPEDLAVLEEYNIPPLDLVIVDLYPFEKTVQSNADETDIIEKIDIGGISLIRAAAKNYKDVAVIASFEMYPVLIEILKRGNSSTLEQRKELALHAFDVSSHYDAAIYRYFAKGRVQPTLKISENHKKTLRYGENPHQEGIFYGDLESMFSQLSGKELSYNNLMDIDAASGLLSEFQSNTCVIVKHTNACGLASRSSTIEAWQSALQSDPVSAFGGIIAFNAEVDVEVANAVNEIFFEVLIAPAFSQEALAILKQKKNRIILLKKGHETPSLNIRSTLNGYLVQSPDLVAESVEHLSPVTDRKPDERELNDLLFALKPVKHLKSNTIVLAKNGQLIGMGCGQTSRVDALKQAIAKANHYGLSTSGAVMASDAFFPFPDCVEIAHLAGITAVVQPGGSVKDIESIEYCNKHGVAMVFTGFRHFKH